MLTASARKNASNSAVDRAVRQALGDPACRDARTRAAFEGLLRHVRRPGLLRPARAGGHAEIVDGLLSLASHHPAWIRPIEGWEPAGGNPVPLFSGLARHLLAAYPVPGFMTSAWFGGRSAEVGRRQAWFLHIGSGRNIREVELPLPYTKRMAHHFLQAPDHFTIDQALRWGQVRGMGGPKGLALAVAAGRLGVVGESEESWATVVRFLVNQPEMDVAQVGPIVDYLHFEKLRPEEPAGADDRDGPGQARPDFSMKGRTLRALLRQVGEWHERLRRPGKLSSLKWGHSGIGDFRLVEREAPEGHRSWTIRELTSGDEVREEGAAMRHCVAQYAVACALGATSIWSMMFRSDQGRFRVMTIEVDPASRTIRQARRRGNAPPNEKALAVMRLWAEREGLTFRFWNAGVLVTG